MKLRYSFFLLAFVVCFSSLSSAAEQLKIGIGISKPPYVIQNQNTGMEYEIVERALAKAGYEMVPYYMPLMRIPHSLNGGALDGGMHLRAHMSIDGFFSNEVISYHNYVITLKENNFKIPFLKELGKLSTVAFQNAHKLLGEEFGEASRENPQYSEIANQALQVRMLAAGRVEAVVADFRIFLHFQKQVQREMKRKFFFTFHRLFQPTPYRAAFRDRTIRDAFDVGLKELRRSGEYDAIVSKYISADDMLPLIPSLSQ